jgi:hypothetical protein
MERPFFVGWSVEMELKKVHRFVKRIRAGERSEPVPKEFTP